MAARGQDLAIERGGDADCDRGGGVVAWAVAVPLCLLRDLLRAAAFLATHPLHAAYLLFFARHFLPLAAFFRPLLVSTALLLAVLATAGPYLAGSAEWPGVRSLGRTCSIAVAALCAGLRPDGRHAGLVGQLCSFVLGPADAASVVRVEEITGELCDITGSCLLLEEKSLLVVGDECKELAFELPSMDGAITEKGFLDHDDSGDFKDEIDDKVVISEDLKGSSSLAEQCRCPSETIFVQGMEAEEDVIQGKQLILSDTDEVGGGVEEKRLECDPMSVEIKKCEPACAMEVKKCEPVQAKEKCGLVWALEIKKCEPAQETEIKKGEPPQAIRIKTPEPVKPLSLIAQRIKQWEAQVSGNLKPIVGDKEHNLLEISTENTPFKGARRRFHVEADACIEKCRDEQQAQEVASTKHSTIQQEQEQEFKDVMECMSPETETLSVKCSHEIKDDEEGAPVVQAAQEHEGCQSVQTELEVPEQQDRIVQFELELEDMEEECKGASGPVAMGNKRASSLKSSTSIAGRVHSRTSSENLVSEGSPSRRDKEWKRTLACKLYEERMQLRLCRDRAVVEGSDNMDMLWEAYEVGGGGNGNVKGVKRGGSKAKGGARKHEDVVEEDEEHGDEEEDEGEGSVRQLCCLQALKFSTRKMNLGGGRPSLVKISKVLKRMTALSRVGSRRSQKG